jgi:hypothetical protein
MPDSTQPIDSYSKNIDEQIALSTDLHKLSGQEFDKQVVYIAGGGLALTLTFAKDIVSVTSSHFLVLLLLTWLCFATALLLNLLSHRKATETYDAARSLHLHYRECHQSQRLIDAVICDGLKSQMNKADDELRRLNLWSFYGVGFGIASFILFVFINLFTLSEKPNPPQSAPATKPQVPTQPDSIRGIPAPNSLLTTPPPPVVLPAPAPQADPGQASQPAQ